MTTNLNDNIDDCILVLKTLMNDMNYQMGLNYHVIYYSNTLESAHKFVTECFYPNLPLPTPATEKELVKNLDWLLVDQIKVPGGNPIGVSMNGGQKATYNRAGEQFRAFVGRYTRPGALFYEYPHDERMSGYAAFGSFQIMIVNEDGNGLLIMAGASD